VLSPGSNVRPIFPLVKRFKGSPRWRAEARLKRNPNTASLATHGAETGAGFDGL
jgi:hypothetical protein